MKQQYDLDPNGGLRHMEKFPNVITEEHTLLALDTAVNFDAFRTQGSNRKSSFSYETVETKVTEVPYGYLFILVQPVDQYVTKGEILTLTLEAKSNPQASYLWYKDAQEIETATEATYTKIAEESDAGTYFCHVSNLYNYEDSQFVNVLVGLGTSVTVLSSSPDRGYQMIKTESGVFLYYRPSTTVKLFTYVSDTDLTSNVWTETWSDYSFTLELEGAGNSVVIVDYKNKLLQKVDVLTGAFSSFSNFVSFRSMVRAGNSIYVYYTNTVDEITSLYKTIVTDSSVTTTIIADTILTVNFAPCSFAPNHYINGKFYQVCGGAIVLVDPDNISYTVLNNTPPTPYYYQTSFADSFGYIYVRTFYNSVYTLYRYDLSSQTFTEMASSSAIRTMFVHSSTDLYYSTQSNIRKITNSFSEDREDVPVTDSLLYGYFWSMTEGSDASMLFLNYTTDYNVFLQLK